MQILVRKEGLISYDAGFFGLVFRARKLEVHLVLRIRMYWKLTLSPLRYRV